mgnify:CR=1 FL=1
MKVRYNKLWKLLIDKGMKRVNYEKRSGQAKVHLRNSEKMKMLPFPCC